MQELNGKKIFIDPGVLPASEMKRIIDCSSMSLSIITEDHEIKDEFSRISDDIPTYLYPQLVEKSGGILSKSVEKYNVWKKIIDDHQTYLLYDRAYFGLRSNQLKTADIISDCIECQRFIDDHKIDALIYMATPHKLATWIFARTAELMGVDVYYFQETIMPWRQYLYKGVSRNAELIKFGFQESKDDKAVKGFIEAKSSGFDEAFPETEKVKLRKNKGKFYSLYSDIKNGWKRPDHIINIFAIKNIRKLAITKFCQKSM